MTKRFSAYFLLIIFILSTTVIIQVFAKTIHSGQQIVPTQSRGYLMNIILLPLDSRPPCTQFVEQLAAIIGIKVILPPQYALDDYNNAADKIVLRRWLKENIKQADAAIVSIDMLIHGGLLASRHARGTAQDQQETIDLLTEIHTESPLIPIYAFNIIPRLLIADDLETAQFQKSMAKYSVLKDEVDLFENPADIRKLTKLQSEIPSEIIARHHALYNRSRLLNVRLIQMVENHILAGLVIGQDDGQAFGLPNIVKQSLQTYLVQLPDLQDKVFITRGTDELALTLLGNIVMERSTARHRIYVTYTHPQAPEIVMPFMPNTVRQTIEEKIHLARGVHVASPQEADFILFVHIGTRNTKDKVLFAAVHELKSLLDQGYKVAVVDLTEDYFASETLLSRLLQEDSDLTQLIAYAGWNTTSNSIGSAITQSILFNQALQVSRHSVSATVEIYKNNLEFLVARFLDDWYYQKVIQPDMNRRLHALDIDPYNLDSQYQKTDTMIRDQMQNQARHLLNHGLYNKPITITIAGHKQKLVITDLQVATYLPWHRTFELHVQPNLSLAWWQE